MIEEPEKNTWEWDLEEIQATINGTTWFATVTMTGDISWELKDFECCFTGRSSEEWVGKPINPRVKSIGEAYNADTDTVGPLPEGGRDAFSAVALDQIKLQEIDIPNVDPKTGKDFE